MPLFPKVTGLSVAAATASITDQGFTSTPNITPKEYNNAWKVIDQTPRADSEQSTTVSINLTADEETSAEE